MLLTAIYAWSPHKTVHDLRPVSGWLGGSPVCRWCRHFNGQYCPQSSMWQLHWESNAATWKENNAEPLPTLAMLKEFFLRTGLVQRSIMTRPVRPCGTVGPQRTEPHPPTGWLGTTSLAKFVRVNIRGLSGKDFSLFRLPYSSVFIRVLLRMT